MKFCNKLGCRLSYNYNFFFLEEFDYKLSCNKKKKNLVGTLTKQINMATYFAYVNLVENILLLTTYFTVKRTWKYFTSKQMERKTHVKFHANQMLFTIQFINLFFMYKFRVQKLKI